MNKLFVLVVEDDPAIRNLMSTTLRSNGYRFATAQTGASALLQAASDPPDVMLLDLGLPDLDGVEIIRTIRTWSQLPIIVISARSEDSDKIQALDAGADDYLVKPFSVEELLARLRVTQRRLAILGAGTADPVFVNGALRVDYSAGCAWLGSEPLKLTPMEWKLLCVLCQNVGKVLTHTYLTQHVWGSALDSDIASLRVFLASLRKKLGRDGTQYIQTHIGVGYRMMKL